MGWPEVGVGVVEEGVRRVRWEGPRGRGGEARIWKGRRRGRGRGGGGVQSYNAWPYSQDRRR